jgi:hypothetical protein
MYPPFDLNHLADFHETWYERYAIGGNTNLIIFNCQ